MSKVDPKTLGSSTPKITPDDIEERAILTVVAYEEITMDDEETGESRKSATLIFEETGDKVLWLNVGMAESLVEQLGSNSDKWPGQKVPVEAYVAMFKGKKFPKVRVLPAEEWEAAFKESGTKRGGVKPKSGRGRGK